MEPYTAFRFRPKVGGRPSPSLCVLVQLGAALCMLCVGLLSCAPLCYAKGLGDIIVARYVVQRPHYVQLAPLCREAPSLCRMASALCRVADGYVAQFPRYVTHEHHYITCQPLCAAVMVCDIMCDCCAMGLAVVVCCGVWRARQGRVYELFLYKSYTRQAWRPWACACPSIYPTSLHPLVVAWCRMIW